MAEGLPTNQLTDFEGSLGITSLSQLFVNLYIFEKSINWELSAMKTATKCRVCRRKANDEMILCDLCNRGYHIYCLKPPIASIDDIEGDWFCYTCVPRKNDDTRFASKSNDNARFSAASQNESIDDESCSNSETSEEPIESNNTSSAEGNQSLCRKCKKRLYDEYSEASIRTFKVGCVTTFSH